MVFKGQSENMWTSIVKLTDIDDSSNENGGVIFQKCQQLEKYEEDNLIE